MIYFNDGSGNWTQISALNTLYEAGVLTERLGKNWTALAGACSKGYPGKKPVWKLLGVAKGQDPPAGWTGVEFDDGSWTSGAGPISASNAVSRARRSGSSL